MLPTDTFFADIEQVIATFADHDRVRVHELIAELEHIAARVPRVAERCYAYQARLFARLQLFTEALACVEKARVTLPTDDTLTLLRGDIYRQAADFGHALEDYSTVLKLRPDSVTARMHRAETLQAQGDPRRALDDVNQALRLEPRSLRLLYRRALILTDLHRLPEALTDLRLVAQLSPDPDLKQKAQARLRELGEQ